MVIYILHDDPQGFEANVDHDTDGNLRMKVRIFILSFFVGLFFVQLTSAADVEQINRSVSLIDAPSAKYPTIPMYKAVEGWAKVEFTITDKGNTSDFKIIESNPPNYFGQAAIESIKKFEFSPEIKDGKPISVRASQLIEFELPESVPILNKKMLGLMVAIDIASKRSGVKYESLKLPEDVTVLIKSVEVQSSIKTHEKSLSELIIHIQADESGRPNNGTVNKNTYSAGMDENNINDVIEGAVFRAQYIYDNFNGYYNPYFNLMAAKSIPARIVPTYVAKSKPLPQVAIDFQFTAELHIDSEGVVTNISNPKMDGEPLEPIIAFKMIEEFHFLSARKKYKAIADDVELKITFSLVQKYDVGVYDQ